MADTLTRPDLPASGTALDEAAQRVDRMDPCHAEILVRLQMLDEALAEVARGTADARVRQVALDVVKFFDDVAAPHHQHEEREVFPVLLARGDKDLVQHVQRLQQDHGWLEQDWLELGPQLRALGENSGWVDPAMLAESVEVFAGLYREHIDLEESLIYPAAASMKLQADLARQRRRQRAETNG